MGADKNGKIVNSGNNPYVMNDDGSITRLPDSELDIALLNIMRVGAGKDNLLAAYNAQKKCFKLCRKERAHQHDYKEYVETLQVYNFPDELKKADYGARYKRVRDWTIFFVILLIGLLVSGILCFFHVIFDYDGGWIFMIIATCMIIIIFFMQKKMNALSQSIRALIR